MNRSIIIMILVLLSKPGYGQEEAVEKPEPIKDTLAAVREQLDFLGRPSVKQKANNNTLVCLFESNK